MTPSPVHHIRIPDELWERAQTKADARLETVAGVIRRLLLAYVEGED